MTCTECHGTRVTVRLEREIRRSQGCNYFTGRQVERLYQCETCHGTGQGPEPEPAGSLTWHGAPVVAPGFTAETFSASLQRARERGYMNIRPSRNGAVQVDSGRTGAVYTVTRERCDCQAGRSHGYCCHRAAVIACADIFGLNVCRVEILGFDPNGQPVTAYDRLVQTGEAA